MRKTTLRWLLTLFVVFGFALTSNADVCTQTFSESGNDDDPTTVTISPSDITCTGGGTIDSIKIVNTSGSFTNSNCGNWYDFTLIVDGATIIANGCQSDFDGTDIAANFNTIEVHSNDLDNYSDGVTITFDLEVYYTPPSCPAPSGLTASSITATEATLSWVAGGTETNWNVEYGIAGFTQGNGTTVTATDTFTTLTGLNAATDYEFYVQADCGGGDQSVWGGPYAFSTVCAGANTLPFAENFENGISLFKNANNNNTNFEIETTIVKEGSQSVHVAYTVDNNDSLIVRCPIDLTGNTNPKLTFWHIAKTEGGWDKCYVKISIDGGATWDILPDTVYEGEGNYSTYFHEDSYSEWGTGSETPDNTWWKKETFKLGAYNTSSDVYILFELTSDGSTQREGWYIDDIKIEQVNCEAATGLTASNITANSATLSWITPGASEFNLVYGPTGFNMADSTAIAVTDTFYNVAGLTAGTEYDFYVRDICGAGDSSAWVGPYTFMTSCETPATITTFPWTHDFESGNVCDFIITDSLSNGVEWEFASISSIPSGDFSANNNTSATCLLADGSAGNGANTTVMSPEIDLSSFASGNILELSFESQFQDYAGNGDAQVIISTDNMATWTQVWSETNDQGSGGEIITLDLTSYISGASNLYIAWNYSATATDAWQWAIDNISLKLITCPNPSGLTATNITTDSATLSWISGGSNNYNIVYGPAGFNMADSTAIAVTDTFYIASGLTAATSYEFYVQDSCGAGDVSEWVGPFTFTTECDTYNIPWTESFENISVAGEFPNCVAFTGDFTTGIDSTSDNRYAHTGSNYLYTKWSADDWFFTVGVNLTAGQSYDFSYWYITDGNSGWTEVSSWVGTAQDAASMTDSLTGVYDSTNTVYYKLKGTYVAPTTGTYYFGVHVVANSNPWYISFDDFKIEETPAAPTTDLALIMPANGANYYGCDFTGQDTVNIQIKNVGTTVIPANDTILTWYELDGATAVADTLILANDLNANDTVSFQFAQLANLAGYTTHNFKVYFSYDADTNNVNDTAMGTVTHYEPTVDLGGTNDTITVSSYPYTLDAGAGFNSYLWNDSTTNQTLEVNADGWYSVAVEDTNGCEANDSVYVVLNTGINTFAGVNLSIYPNPNNGQFTLSANLNTNTDFDVRIIDLNGKVVYSKHFEGVQYLNETIDIDSYAKGMYYVRISNNKFVKQEKVVIK